MTELEFWAALVADYPSTAHRLPTLTSKKIRAGVPPPLRGVVWPSIAGARDTHLFEEFGRLCGESSPYEGLIGKDIGRSFPNVEMFRDPNGEGQQMLARVLKCFSLYDTKIGYCQGLGFVVGPMLMHMTDAESFCVLIRFVMFIYLVLLGITDFSGSWNTTTCARASCQTCQGCTCESTSSRISSHATYLHCLLIYNLSISNRYMSHNGFFLSLR
jgi:Rab-GTPase-TBC domain